MAEKVRILIADDNKEFCELVGQMIDSQDDMVCIGCVHDGQSAVLAAKEMAPDLVILDHVMPVLDGIGVLESVRAFEDRPRILMLTAFGQEHLIQRAAELGVDYYLMKPFDFPTLIQRIRQICNPSIARTTFQDEKRRQQIEKQVAQLLSALGVPPHFKGYTYLRDAITSVVLDPDLLGAVTTELYPQVAKQRNTTSTKVERAIRHAIESTWMRGNLQFIDELFAHTVDADKGKPTNSSFIARLADHVRLELVAS